MEGMDLKTRLETTVLSQVGGDVTWTQRSMAMKMEKQRPTGGMLWRKSWQESWL
jgi:hypothetical protein